MKQLRESFFKVICFSFSAFILVMFLLTTIDVSVERDKRGRLAREVQELTEDNERLTAQVESLYSLEAIENYAREILGMRECTSGQIVYLDLSE